MRAFAIPDPGSLVHLHNVSGGVLAGDRLALDVAVGAGATAQITTTGATRLYRHRAGSADSEQRVRFIVGESAQLEYLPDALIPYAGSRHSQHMKVRLGSNAAFFGWEVLAPGRLAAGERFAYERLRLKSEIYAGPRLVLQDNFLVEPRKKNPSATIRMAGYSHLASLCVIQEGRAPAFWKTLEEELNELARHHTRVERAVWGASALVSDGVVVRGLSASAVFLYEPLIEYWRTARLAITGKDAVPPRKTY